MSNEQSNKPKKRRVFFPQVKTFTSKRKWYQRNKTVEELDNEVNQFMKEKARQEGAPMPGKCFSNHRTGEVFYVVAFSSSEEIDA